MRFKVCLTLIAVFIAGITCVSSNSVTAQSRDIVIGKTVTIKSAALNEDRNIMIWQPAGYNAGTNKYPVLYLLDGEGHFNYASGVIEFLTQQNIIPQMIVVGIANSDRGRDFTPTKVQNIPNSGGAAKFMKFMGEELIPYIDKNYRTQPYRILAGHSLCGMFSFNTMLEHPQYFNSFIGMSPWVIYDNGYIVNHAKLKFENIKSLNKTFYFTAGSLEANLLPTMAEFINLLKDKAPKDLDWKYKLMEGEDHGSLVLMSLYDGLKYIYKGWALPAAELEKGLNAILAHYKDLSAKFGYEIAPAEAQLNNAGYALLLNGKNNEAIEMFKKNVELYPRSANVYDSLGEAYERSNQLALAKENYSKAFEIAQKENNPLLGTFKANYERASKMANK